MSAFWQTACTAFSAKFIYRANSFLSMLSCLVRMAVPMFVWTALYASTEEAAINDRTLGEMLLYVLISQICMSLVTADFAETIENRMRTGVIEYNFIRPLSPRLIFVGESFGQSIYSMLKTAVPALLLAAVLIPQIGFSITIAHAAFFVVSLVLGYLVSIMFELLKGMFAFWFVNVYILNWFMDLFYVLLSGAYVPLWFYPGWLRTIAGLLPFQAAYYLPVEIFLGIRDIPGGFAVLGVQLFWIAVLWVLQEILWRKSVYKLTVMGG